MSDHLPECQPKTAPEPPFLCICPELRACEERMCKEFAMAYYLPKRVAMTNEEIAGRIMVRALRLTWDEREALYDEWVSISESDRDAAAIGADVGGSADNGAVGSASTLHVYNVSSYADTGIGAALAVLARDSRSESGPFTFKHYEILTRPWRQVIGAVHPDDDTGEDMAR